MRASTLTPNSIHQAIQELRKREGRSADGSNKTYELYAVPFAEAPKEIKGIIKSVDGLSTGVKCGNCRFPQGSCCFPNATHFLQLPDGWL